MSDANRIPFDQAFLDRHGLTLQPVPKDGSVSVGAAHLRWLFVNALCHLNAERLIDAAAALVEARKGKDDSVEMVALEQGLTFYREAAEEARRNAEE